MNHKLQFHCVIWFMGLMIIGSLADLTALADSPSVNLPPKQNLTLEQEVATDGIVVEYYRTPTKEFEIWLAGEDHRTSKTLLAAHQRSINPVVISPNLDRLAINEQVDRNHSIIKIYKRTHDLFYQEERELNEKLDLWSFFTEHNNLVHPLKLNHSHTRCILWSSNGTAFLFSLSGVWDANVTPAGSTRNWLGVFKTTTKECTYFLGVMNRHTLSLEQPEQPGSKKESSPQGGAP